MRALALLFVVAALLAAAPAALACTLASFSAGPVDVDATVAAAHLDPLAGNVQLNGLLGAVLCPVLGAA
jgi:hypothetical protein